MTLIGGTDNGNSTIYTADDTAIENLIKVGDNIKISGTASNNGVFTVSDITTDGTDDVIYGRWELATALLNKIHEEEVTNDC